MLTQQGQIAPEGFLTISPTGDRLAFRAVADGAKADTTMICILDLGTRQIRTITVDAQISALLFSDRGSSLDYVENTPTGARIFRRSIDGVSPAKLMVEIPQDRIFAMAWSPDEQTMALARGRQDNDAILLTGF
jgi:Tol biopolymer transport system component